MMLIKEKTRTKKFGMMYALTVLKNSFLLVEKRNIDNKTFFYRNLISSYKICLQNIDKTFRL